MINWILPLKNRGRSGPDLVSFLSYEETVHGPIYISDNHKTAIWAWGQEIKKSPALKYGILHIDAHYDCDDRGHKEFPANWKELSYEDFYSLRLEDGRPLVRWDNYLPLYLKTESQMITKKIGLTHQIGKKIDFDQEIALWDIFKSLDDILISNNKWILNLDLDYFFVRRFKESPLMTDLMIIKFFEILHLAFEENKIICTTIALSPECCGSWENSQHILSLFCQVFNIKNPLA